MLAAALSTGPSRVTVASHEDSLRRLTNSGRPATSPSTAEMAPMNVWMSGVVFVGQRLSISLLSRRLSAATNGLTNGFVWAPVPLLPLVESFVEGSKSRVRWSDIGKVLLSCLMHGDCGGACRHDRADDDASD